MVHDSLQYFDIPSFQGKLLSWYKVNKRDLPWRKTRDPYKIWVSEIMLQQTQVNTVIPYFNRFMKKYPTVFHLAAAKEQEVLKVWEGLGYYARARNMLEAAQQIVQEYDGKLPNDPKQLKTLKGIGPYTKGAILSIAFNQREPAVDGNVIRVYSRLLKIEDETTSHRTRRQITQKVYETIPKKNPRDFNQAIMELGALICTPKKPLCILCPVQEHCQAFAAGIEEELPIKKKQRKQKIIPYAVLLIEQKKKKQIVIEKRADSGLLANMWQFPMVPMDEIGLGHVSHWLYGEYGLKISPLKKVGQAKHVFSHLIWDMTVYKAELLQSSTDDERLQLIEQENLDVFPFPTAHAKLKDFIF